MRRNDFFNFNPYQYEKQLSPFGRQVLKTLVKICERDRIRDSVAPPQRRYNRARNRIITFGESQNSVPIRQVGISDANNNDIDPEFMDFRDDISVDQQQWPFQPSEPLLPPPLMPLPPPPPVLSILSPIVPSPPPPPFLPSLPPPPLPFRPPSPPPLLLLPLPAPLAGSTQQVPKSTELVTTVAAPASSENRLTRDDLITSVDNSIDFLDNIDKSNDDNYFEFENTVENSANKESKTLQSSSHIDWDDMFDTELIPKATTSNVEAVENVGDANIYCSQTTIQTFDIKHTSMSKKQINEVKKPKRVNQSKVTDAIPKKVKKVKTESKDKTAKVPTKNNFRKQKYTKTVSNWLNDVDPSNTVDEDPVPTHIEEAAQPVYKPEGTKEKVSKDKGSKKVFQAQLKNKGGIMKFGKPTNADGEKDKDSAAVDASAASANKPPEKEAKGKKTKPKFVAPIKSQTISQKVDITYEINTVEEAGILDQDRQFLCSLSDQEICATVLYSNGFNQLNSHCTEDACLPEGVMLHVNDCFYYLKGVGNKIGDILLILLKDNTTVCYDGKAVLRYFMDKFDMKLETTLTLRIFDTKIAGCLLTPDSPPGNFSDTCAGIGGAACPLAGAAHVTSRAAWYCERLRSVAAHMTQRLREGGLWDVFVDVEMPLLPVVADMERRGVAVDVERLNAMERVLLEEMKRVEAACYAAAGRTFQINSPHQVRALVYDELRLDTKLSVRVRETAARGDKSTSEAVLRSLRGAHPLPGLILSYRRLHKAHATFLAGVKLHVRQGRVNTTWEQVAAATGRMASSAPNLQAIPKAPFSLNAEDGVNPEASPGESRAPLLFRSVYVCGAGRVLVSADFQQVECRVFAACAGDAALRDALAASDLFRTLAAVWLHKAASEVTMEERERTKRIVYAGLYGAGARKLMDILQVDYARATDILASFNKTFPSLKRFGPTLCERVCNSGGIVRTLRGRRRTLLDIDSGDSTARAHAQRQALNYLVQGTAADLCKQAMVSCCRQLAARQLDARLMLQIHDELVWDVRDQHLAAAAAVIKAAMESSGLSVGLPRLPVELRVGRHWGLMEPYTTIDEALLNQQDGDL